MKLYAALIIFMCLMLIAVAPSAVQLKPVTPTVTPLPSVLALKGLAQADWGHNEDRAALGASWWYAWSDGNRPEPAVNMSKYGALSIGCYPYLLFLNEPENTQDVNLTPAQAVPLVVAQQAHCPSTTLVMGNTMQLSWLQTFLSRYISSTGHPFVGVLGWHSYCWGDAAPCVTDFNTLLSSIPGYRVWVTEFNCVGCSVAGFTSMVNAFGRSARVDRYAVYTNRQPCNTDCSWVMPGADLVNSNGTLTANGQAYRNWPTK